MAAAEQRHNDAKHAHEAAVANKVDADAANKRALEAVNKAEETRKEKHQAKQTTESAGILEAKQLATSDWKKAVAEMKQREQERKQTKAAAAHAEEARKSAWEELKSAKESLDALKSEKDQAAAQRFCNNHRTHIKAPRQASEGMKPWHGAGKITRVQIKSAQLPPLDGHLVKDVDGNDVHFDALDCGVVVLAAGTGGKKTVTIGDFLKRKGPDVPVVFITSRINQAHKGESDFEALQIDGFHNYKRPPNETSVNDWMNHHRVIVSIEQVSVLDEWMDKFRGAIVIVDEIVTLAGSVVNGATVWEPTRALLTMRQLVQNSGTLIVADADFDGDGKGKRLLEWLAPQKPILHVQTVESSLPTTLMLYFEGVKGMGELWRQRKLASVTKSRDDRVYGLPSNKPFIGVDWPSDATKIARKMRKRGAHARVLHGGLAQPVQDEAKKDVDAYFEDTDAVGPLTNVVGIATDLKSKCSQGFVHLRAGEAGGPRAGLQRVGRVNRDRSKPLDPYTMADGTILPGGVVHVLLPGKPPDLMPPDASRGKPEDRAEDKFKAMKFQTAAQRDARRGTAQVAENFRARCDQVVLTSGGSSSVYSSVRRRSELEMKAAAVVADLQAWKSVDDDDKRTPAAYGRRFLELNMLPNRNFPLVPCEPLSAAEKQAPGQAQAHAVGGQVLTEDEAVGEMTNMEKYVHPEMGQLQALLQLGAARFDSPFWDGCYGFCPPGLPRKPNADNRDAARMLVYDVTKYYRVLPKVDEKEEEDDEGGEEEMEEEAGKKPPRSQDYADLLRDKDKRHIVARGMMRFLTPEQIKLDEARGRWNGAYADPTVGAPRAAHMQPLLEQLARVLSLKLADLLEPREFTSEKHEWLKAHNAMVSGAADDGAKAMACHARRIAIQLGCSGIKHGDKLKNPTSLLDTMSAVLAQCCAMRPRAREPKQRAVPLHRWTVTELAPGFAEKALHWHEGLKREIPLGEYAACDAEMKKREAEKKAQEKEQQLCTDLDAWQRDALGMSDDEASAAPLAKAAPFNENVSYMHYSKVAIGRAIVALTAEEPQRKAALSALDLESADARSKGDAQQLEKIEKLQHALRRLADRLRVAHDLKLMVAAHPKGVPETYEYKAHHGRVGVGRRYAKAEGWLGAGGKWRSSSSQGMPGDLRSFVVDGEVAEQDGRASDPTIDVILAFKLGLPRGCVSELVTYLAIDESRAEWHDAVAQHHGTTAAQAKRWPNILSNSGTYNTCLEECGLPLNAVRCERVKRMETQLHQLQPLVVRALRAQPNALWPGSEHFWGDEMERIERDHPELEERKRQVKAYSYLRQTVEDKILATNASAQRQAQRDAMGFNANRQYKFDLLQPEERDTIAYQFDGLMVPSREGCDSAAGNPLANRRIKEAGWHAAGWDIFYQIVEKPMARVDPDEWESTKEAHEALQTAKDTYPSVAVAVAEVTAAAGGEEESADGEGDERVSGEEEGDMSDAEVYYEYTEDEESADGEGDERVSGEEEGDMSEASSEEGEESSEGMSEASSEDSEESPEIMSEASSEDGENEEEQPVLRHGRKRRLLDSDDE